MRRLIYLALPAVLALGVPGPSQTTPAQGLSAREECPESADRRTERGWQQYRSGDMAGARAEFGAAVDQCPAHTGALTGLGYVALRDGDLAEAVARFSTVVEGDSEQVDALVGLGLVAWRRGDLPEAHERFAEVLRVDPSRADARDYLARLPRILGPPPVRPPLVLPDTTVYPARTAISRFEVRTPRGWEPFYIKGVNLGAALPGRNPSEFPDSATYAEWIRQIGGMGANTIRLYTIHPPHLYRALERYNRDHPQRPLWLIQGVWTELPPAHDYENVEWKGQFFAEMHRVVDVLHGRADVEPRPGHAWGHYTADVSRWVLAYIIGREWEPYSVVGFDELHPGLHDWRGRYLTMTGGSASEAWMAKASEEIISYEMESYRAQRPVAYTNWPTLDPISHPTELGEAEEMQIRGVVPDRPLRRHDEDVVSLGQTPVRATVEFPAGYFAAFHAYPYYPDFMVLDPEYGRTRSPLGASNYFGYLTELKRHFHDIPVVIAEYGVPASLGTAHLQPQGWHHGGHTERAMAEIDARLTQEIAAAGMAGGIVFAWIDEWFKKNWLVIDFEIPLERNLLWLNRLDPEQHYGMLAMEPAEILPGATLRDRLPAWDSVPALYETPDGIRVRGAADEAHLWVLVEGGAARSASGLMLGFDVLDSSAGDFRWPGRIGPRLPVGLEFVLLHERNGVRLVVDPPYNPFALTVVPKGSTNREVTVDIDAPPAGFFTGRYAHVFNRPYLPVPNSDGVYEPLRLITNVPRVGRDSTGYVGLGYDRGRLPAGPPPDGNWEFLESENAFEVRIPWGLLNITDPSQRRVLRDHPGSRGRSDFGTGRIDGIRVLAALPDGEGEWRTLPGSGVARDVALFSWDIWETPRWRPRVRPVYDAMRQAFETIRPPVLEAGGES